MTTAHKEEPLKEAAWFAASVAFPDEAYSEADSELVALCVGGNEWATEVCDYLRAGAPIDDEA